MDSSRSAELSSLVSRASEFRATASSTLSSSPTPEATINTICNITTRNEPVSDSNLNYPICQLSWPQKIPDLARCCNAGVEVQIIDNCTQYCESDLSSAQWRACAEGLNYSVSGGFLVGCSPNLTEPDSPQPSETGGAVPIKPIGILFWCPILLGVIGFGLGLQ